MCSYKWTSMSQQSNPEMSAQLLKTYYWPPTVIKSFKYWTLKLEDWDHALSFHWSTSDIIINIQVLCLCAYSELKLQKFLYKCIELLVLKAFIYPQNIHYFAFSVIKLKFTSPRFNIFTMYLKHKLLLLETP